VSEKYRDYTNCVTVTELDVLHADSLHSLHEMRQEERQLVARIIALRKDIKVQEEYAEDVSDFIKDFLDTAAHPERRIKTVAKHRDIYLKKYKNSEYKLTVQIRDLKDLAIEAHKYANLPDFNPNGIRAGFMRTSLEKGLLTAASLPDIPEVVQLRVDLKTEFDRYTPRTQQEEAAIKLRKQQQQIDLEQQVMTMATGMLQKVKEMASTGERPVPAPIDFNKPAG
jgi:hypothetical protein